MIRGIRMKGGFLFFGAAFCGLAIAAPGADESCRRFEKILAALHPDFPSYIGEIRQGPSILHPANLYMGLVRAGGKDPSRPEDAPLVGRGVRNDVIVYADSREAGRSEGWAMLLIDHEYFHARHLARGDQSPIPSFGEREIDRHYFEAIAWAYNLIQADEEAYPTLTHADYREAFRTYSLHFEAFRDYVLRHDRPAWAHYRRFLPDPASLGRTLIARN